MTGFDIAMAGLLSFGQVIPSAQREIVKHAGLQMIHADGAVTLRLKETGREERAVEGGRIVTVKLQDEHYPVYVTRYVKTWNDCDAVETWYELRHEEPGPVKVLRADSFAARVDCRADVVKVLTLTGVWALEANVTEATVANGQIAQFRSLAGTRDAWESNAAMMVSFGGDVDEERGKVLGVALEWTGTTEKRVRRSWNGRETEVFAGIDMETGPYTLDPGKTFTTPRAILVWSEKGKGEVSRQYHRWARRHLMPHGDVLHPILLNTWEGSYFSFTEMTLTDMMDGVKEMGGEMLVLDDGWFGKGKYARDNKNRDKTGLGDWVVNPEKLPHGLAWLADEAAKRGLKFGLWVEPEMCNVASWLAEAHPDWILREKNRSLLLGRGGSQVVLDYTNPAVRENIYQQLDAIYAQVPTLAYVKWDSNQNIVNPGSTYLKPDRQPNLWYDYTIGLYDLLAKLQAKRPHIMVQACASGGGHMDFGFLRYADEFWASDNTDPFRRVFIQWGASQFYPASAMACHVTKRGSSMKYRFDVAMTGRMGFELHPKNLSKEDVAFAKAAVEDYKRIRPIVQRGDLYRLVSPYGGRMSALMFASEAKDGAAVFALGLDKDIIVEETLRLRGLDPDAKYVVTEINKGAKLHAKLPKDPVAGRTLMEKGIAVRLSGKFDSASFEVALVAPVPLVGGLVKPVSGRYVVVFDKTGGDEWKKVASALSRKHDAKIVEYEGLNGLVGVIAELKKIKPKYVCFVVPPESAGRNFVGAAFQVMRRIDDDPYGDAIWGVVTGYSAADGMRIVQAPLRRDIRSLATSMGGAHSLDNWASGFASDERTADNFWVKRPGGANEKVATGGNIAKALADAFNTIPVDYFVTSGHARERNWQIVYNQNKGMLIHTAEAGLQFVEPGGARHNLTNASLKVYVGAGNCLIGHVDRRACMATAWMHAAGVEQFAGYTVPSWYGFMGWGVSGLFSEGRYSLAEARYLENERLLWAKTRKHKPMDEKGLAYDRDVFAFYGDPAQRIMFPEDKTPYKVVVKGDSVRVTFTSDCSFAPLDDARGARPVMALLDEPPPGDALLGADGKEVADSVVTERFVFIPAPGKHVAGETLEFKIGRRAR